MVRLFRRSCLGVLAILMFGIVAVLSVLAVMFQQSQAVNGNVAATVQSRATSTQRPTLPMVPLPTVSIGEEDGEVTIQIQTTTPIPSSIPMSTLAPTYSLAAQTPTISGTVATDLPRYSGTSSYPLTVTAEVLLGLTHVAGYQAEVAATRTAIAAESDAIYATLTAAAPIPTMSAP